MRIPDQPHGRVQAEQYHAALLAQIPLTPEQWRAALARQPVPDPPKSPR